MNDSEFVTLATFASETTAQMLSAYLEEAGIDCMVQGQASSEVLPSISSLSVVINRRDEVRAREILDSLSDM